MSQPVIEIHSLAKQYKLGQSSALSLPALRRLIRRLSGRPASTDTAVRSIFGIRETFWALKDVSFNVHEGEVLGIVGSNGAGKSTLLKILSRITPPTEGAATLRGRVASLLEVGTGFHPELTGRENIFLNGSILGMSRAETLRRFDEIVAFADLGRFLDTPVKRYSSGMYVRLAFAVAAHLDAEVLLVDEVLAVGDVSFQRKCLGKMQSIAGSGRTVLFVSHNLAAVTALCSRAIRLREGHVVSDGAPAEIVNAYVAEYFQSAHERDFPPNPAQKMQIRKVACDGTRVGDHGPLLRTQPFAIRVTYDVNEPTTEPEIALTVERSDGSPVCQTRDVDTDAHQEAVRAPGQYTATVTFPGGLLNAGTYVVRVAIERSGGWERYDYQDGIALELYDLDGDVRMQSRGQTRPGVLGLALPWQTVQISSAKAPASLSESLA